MNDIYYKSASGEVIYLDRAPFWMQTGNFLNYEWAYNTRGNKITGFQKEIAEKEFLITVSGDTEEEYAANWNQIHDVFEKDIYRTTPGKLYFGAYYLNCYVFASEKTEWEYGCCMHDNLYYLATDHSFWAKEESYYIPPVNITGLIEINRVPADLENTNFKECDFVLKAYGPFEEVLFYINDNQYRIVTACEESEYLLLDTRNETIVKVDASGNKTNVYSTQVFSLDNFKKIPAGENILRYKRDYAIEITLFHERSEPKWHETSPDAYYIITTEDGYPLTTEDGYLLLGEETVGGA